MNLFGRKEGMSRRQMEKIIERLKVENEDLTESVEKYKPLAMQMLWLTNVAPKITWGAGSPAEATLYRMDFGSIQGETLSHAVIKAMARESQMRD